MSDDFLKIKLRRVIRRYQWLAFWRKLAASWAAAALIACGLVLIQRETGWSSPHTLPIFAAGILAAIVAIAVHHFSRAPDYRWIAKKIEAKHPELNGVLLTAVQQDLAGGGVPGFLQYRVVQEATARSQESDWRQVFPTSRFAVMHVVHLVALGCFIFALTGLKAPPIHGSQPAWIGTDGISVLPGDTTIEKGDSLVVLARFANPLPPSVNLVVRASGTAPRNVPLVKSLADPVFGGSVPEVATDLTYQLEYRGQKSREFKVTVFEHPKLVRSDVDLKFPDYTKLPSKHIEDTRRVSAVEGTALDFALQLNKPVKSAKLVSRDKKTTIDLKVSPDKAVASVTGFVPEKSGSYDLQLLDAENRANKVSSSFVIDVQPNRPPEIKLASPRGDVRPSALEEVTFDGTVFDDFGAAKFGLAYSVNGAEPKSIELGRDVAAKEKRAFTHVVKLEELGVKPDELVSWYVWAEDVGPDGKPRRTNGDLYFAEIRPFDEIFRESQDMQSDDQQQGGGGNQGRKLAELQKQIINATWRLQREGKTKTYVEDAKVVRDSQEQALQQASEAMQEARSPRDQATWKDATQQMIKAIEQLDNAAKEPGPLAQALPAEQSAYQSLLKLQARETAVTRRQRGGGGGGGQNQRQIDQLDLQQNENRYETQRQAKAPQSQERREQLAVMNRLQELARRQQDLNERLKELQTALQEAKTEQEKEDIRRRLKRLEEEQRQMLADADEIRQRMERPENQSSMSEQRQQLDKTREDLQRAADATADGSVAQALASGTRAQRQLQDMRDDMRKQNSSQFAEDMREMRSEARELSRQQDEITQKLDQLGSQRTQRKSLTESGDRKELTEQLDKQRERMTKLVDRAQQVSEQAENTEPLLSRQLYDSVRKLSQDDATSVKEARNDLAASGGLTYDMRERLQKLGDQEGGAKAVQITRDMVNEGAFTPASRASQRARAEIEDLRKGVERAAESVLGDDTEQLKLAQSELDQLTDQLRRELQQQAQNGGGQAGDERQPGQGGPQTADNNQRNGRGQPGDQKEGQGERQPGENVAQDGQPRGEQAGQGQQPGGRDGQKQVARNNQKQGQRGQRGQQGEPGQPGEQPGGQQPGQSGEQQAQSQQQGRGQGGGRGGENQQGGDRLANNNDGNPQNGGRSGQRGGDQDPRIRLPNQNDRRGGVQERGGGGGPTDRLVLDDAFRGADYRGGGGIGGWEMGPVWRGPLTTEEFQRWNERLRDVEDLIDDPAARQALALAREQARIFRRNMKDDPKKPDWTKVELQIVKPLVEVRNRVADELARRDSKESLAPIDRDPVPNRFAEGVRRYYEELGKDK